LIGEACWWTLHPASKQRSEGEKVRVGDDLILVSVATERYLVTIHQQNYVALQFFNFCSHLSQHTTKEKDVSIVNASFHVTHWSVAPFGTGLSRVKNVGMTLSYMPTFKFKLSRITTFFFP
jgi:ryanodine receptor 2